MKDLVENILSENYVSAQDIFESRMQKIVEKKLCEMRKDMQAEAFGGLSKQDIEARKKAGYKRASEVLPDPRGKETISPAAQRLRKAAKKKISEAISFGQAAKAVHKMTPDEKSEYQKGMAMRRLGTGRKTSGQAGQQPSWTTAMKTSSPEKDDESAQKQRVAKSWEKFQTDLAGKLERSSAMDKKRTEFLKARPMMRAGMAAKKFAGSKTGQALGGAFKGALDALPNME